MNRRPGTYVRLIDRALCLALAEPNKTCVIGTMTRAQQVHAWRLLLTTRKQLNAHVCGRLKKFTLPNQSSITITAIYPRG